MHPGPRLLNSSKNSSLRLSSESPDPPCAGSGIDRDNRWNRNRRAGRDTRGDCRGLRSRASWRSGKDAQRGDEKDSVCCSQPRSVWSTRQGVDPQFTRQPKGSDGIAGGRSQSVTSCHRTAEWQNRAQLRHGSCRDGRLARPAATNFVAAAPFLGAQVDRLFLAKP